MAASALTTLENAIKQTIDYTRQRKAFGQSILDNQVVHFRLAELQTEIELLRSLTYRAADDARCGEDVTTLASMAKLKAGRLLREVPDSCLQYWGGMGYTWENPVSRFRDGRLDSMAAAPTRSCWRDCNKWAHSRKAPSGIAVPADVSCLARASVPPTGRWAALAIGRQHTTTESRAAHAC